MPRRYVETENYLCQGLWFLSSHKNISGLKRKENWRNQEEIEGIFSSRPCAQNIQTEEILERNSFTQTEIFAVVFPW